VTTSVPSTVVAAALGAGPGRPVEVLRADDHRVHDGDGQGDGVALVSGAASVASGPSRAFTVVRKRLARTRGNRSAWDAVDREVDAYTSGLLDDLPGIAAPRLLGVSEGPGGSVELWLERVIDEVGDWPLERYALAARHLGRFNGAGLTGHRSQPPYGWLSRGWLSQWVEATGSAVRRLAGLAGAPLVHQVFPPPVLDLVLDAWERRADWLATLEALPHGLAHQDAFRRNLVGSGGRTVALDWAFVGPAPVGAETAPLVVATLAFGAWPMDRWQELDDAVRAGYLEGLREAGWGGDAALVAIGHTVASVLRYPLGTVRLTLPYLVGEADHAHVERVLGVPFAEIVVRWAAMEQLGLHHAAEAARLLEARRG
jgi:hypothetical protein